MRMGIARLTRKPVLSPDGASPAGPALDGFVRYDRRSGVLWVAGGAGAAPGADQIAAYELRVERGEWTRRVALDAFAPAEPGLSELTFSRDAPPWIFLRGDPGAAFPGELRLVTLESPETALGLAAYDPAMKRLARSAAGIAEPGVLVLAQPGQQYGVEVEALPGFGAERTVPLAVRDRAAALLPLSESQAFRGTADLAVVEDTRTLYLAHGHEVTAIDLYDPAQPLTLGSVDLGSPVAAAVPCSDGRLCALTAAHPHKLAVLDLSDPGQPLVAGELALPGRCRDLAAEGPRAFLACGGRGVARVTLSDPAAPRLLGELDPGGTATAVALRRKVLAVAVGSSKRLRVYRLHGTGSASLLAEARTSRQGRRIHLAYPYLHVTEGSPGGWRRCLAGRGCRQAPTEVFALDERAGTLTAAGSYDTALARVPLGAVLGRHVVVPQDRGYQVLRAEPAP